MEWKDLAQWIAIAFTLALSILVPLFTQIANNSHQRKMQQEKLKHEEKQKKAKAYENFLLNAGRCITVSGYASAEQITQAGASLQQVYIYSPPEWWDDLDALALKIKSDSWKECLTLVQKLSRLMAEELNKKDLTCNI